MAIGCAVISAVFCAIQWVLSLLSFCSKPTLSKFVWGAVVLFAVLFLYTCYTTAMTMFRFRKDPVFKDAHLKTGISWRDYKRLKDGRNP